MKKLTVRIPEKLAERLRNYAERTGRKISFIVQKAIEEYLDRREEEEHYLIDLWRRGERVQ